MTPDAGASADAATQRFVQLLDKQGLVSLLDAFLTYETLPQTQTSLTELTDLDQGTVSRRINELVDVEIVEEIGGTHPQEYRLDMDHPAATELVEVHTKLHNHVREIHSESEDFNGEEANPKEGSPFIELFRYPTNVKLLTAFLMYPEERLRVRDISRVVNVDYATVSDNIEVLCHVEIIQRIESPLREHTEYVLNEEHPAKEGFQRVIESLRSDEPTTPVDKDAILAKTSGDRVEEVRQQIAELLDHSVSVEFGLEETEEWTQDTKEIMETYNLQHRAGDVASEADSSTATTQRQKSEFENNKSDDEECIYCELDERRLTGTACQSSEQTNATAA
jgi:predicted transcriptional regulator